MKKVREGYKMTEIGEIPEDWEVKSIKEVADVVSGGTPSKNVNEYWEGGYIAWATPTDITKNRGKYIEETELYITESGLKNSSANLLPIGSILMCSRATIGPRCINTVPMATNQGFKSFVCKDNLFNEFMYYLLEIVKDEFISLASGSTFLEISKREVENKLIPVPPLVEQKKIAEILSTVDESIKKTDEIIEKTKELKKGLMQKLLTKGIGHRKFKMTEIGKIPEAWDTNSLGNVGEFKNGINKRKEDFGFGVRFVNIQDVYANNIINSETLGRLNASEKEVEIYKLKYGDIVVVRSSVKPDGVGYPALFEGAEEDVLFCGFTIRYRPNLNIFHPRFLLYLLQSQKIRNIVINKSTISANTNINQQAYSSVVVPIPPLQEQRQIASILSAVDEKIEAEEKRRSQLLQLKKGLMQQLLTGRVRIK